MNDDLDRRLQEWGQSVTPGPDPDFARRTEADLRSAAYFSPAPQEPTRGSRPRFRPALLLGLVMLLAGVAVVALRLFDNDSVETLAMEEARGASITSPNGTSVPAAGGAELPNGTIIEVGPDGFAVVGGVVIPPDSVAVIVDGHVEFFGAFAIPTPTGTPTPTPTPTPEPTLAEPAVPGTEADSTSPTPTVDAATPQPTTERETPRPTPQPTPQRTSEPTPEPSPTPTPEPSPTATSQPEPTATPSEVRVALRSTVLGPKRAELGWSAEGADQVARWRVRARRGDAIATVAVLRGSDARSIVVSRPETGRVFYWVVALDEAGNRLATSNQVAVVQPRIGD